MPHLSWRDTEVIGTTQDGVRLHVRPNDFVENRLCFFGVWEPSITELFHRCLNPGDIVVDVGANIGYYSTLSAAIVGATGKVFAVEASASIRERLQRNIDLNEFTNITIVPRGAWNESSELVLHLVDGNRGSSTLSTLSATAESERVNLERLDETIPLELHEQIRLLKIDVEGAECSALRGAEGILRTARNLIVLVEITPDRLEDLGGSPAAIFEFMESMDYLPYHIPNDYTAESYFDRRSSLELTPVTAIPESPCDLLFARAETLRTTELPILA